MNIRKVSLAVLSALSFTIISTSGALADVAINGRYGGSYKADFFSQYGEMTVGLIVGIIVGLCLGLLIKMGRRKGKK